MLEIYPPGMGDYVYVSDHAFTVQELKETELLIIQRMNNILISCDIDKYVYRLELIHKDLKLSKSSIKIYDKLAHIYKLMQSKELYPGSLSYKQIVEFTK